MFERAISELTPTGVLRAAINTGNALLVTGITSAGDPVGVAPDMADSIATRLGVPIRYVPFSKPGELADAVESNVWDICLIGAEPARATKISFTSAYAEIVATYLVAKDSTLEKVSEVDSPGKRIAVKTGTAYDLWLTHNLKHATLVRANTSEDAFALFTDDNLDALAGLRQGLLVDVQKLAGARILEGQFTSVQQAVGTNLENKNAAAFLKSFIEESKASGLVSDLIKRHHVNGLSVAPLAEPN
jgi:polar amino acid transport system substrate-binding protein